MIVSVPLSVANIEGLEPVPAAHSDEQHHQSDSEPNEPANEITRVVTCITDSHIGTGQRCKDGKHHE